MIGFSVLPIILSYYLTYISVNVMVNPYFLFSHDNYNKDKQFVVIWNLFSKNVSYEDTAPCNLRNHISCQCSTFELESLALISKEACGNIYL